MNKFLTIFLTLGMLLTAGNCRKNTEKGKYMVTTVVQFSQPGNDKMIDKVDLMTPSGIAVIDGKIYFSDYYNHTIQKFDPQTKKAELMAGSPGLGGYRDGIGRQVLLNIPRGMVAEGDNIYFADSGNCVIRILNIKTKEVTTYAGTPQIAGHRDGTLRYAQFRHLEGLTLTPASIYLADTGNSTIRIIDRKTGEVKTLAGLAGVSGTDDGVFKHARFNNPKGIFPIGKYFYVLDSTNGAIKRFNPETYEVVTSAGVPFQPGTSDGKGRWASLNRPSTGFVENGQLIFVDTSNHAVRKFNPEDNSVITIAGDSGEEGFKDGNGFEARFNYPTGIVKTGNKIYIADLKNHAIRLMEEVSGDQKK